MKFTPHTLIARIRERLVTWRPTVNELSHDYRDIGTDFRVFSRRFPGLSRVFFVSVLLVVGIGIGIGLKSVAEKSLTIGHEDYHLVPTNRLYALNALREQALDDGAVLPISEERSYPACNLQNSLDEEL